MIAAGAGRALAIALAPGQAHELPMAQSLLGRSPDAPLRVVADNGRALQTCRERVREGGARPANLNLGDCFAYALAKSLGEPLLFKGDDFARTDTAATLTA